MDSKNTNKSLLCCKECNKELIVCNHTKNCYPFCNDVCFGCVDKYFNTMKKSSQQIEKQLQPFPSIQTLKKLKQSIKDLKEMYTSRINDSKSKLLPYVEDINLYMNKMQDAYIQYTINCNTETIEKYNKYRYIANEKLFNYLINNDNLSHIDFNIDNGYIQFKTIDEKDTVEVHCEGGKSLYNKEYK